MTTIPKAIEAAFEDLLEISTGGQYSTLCSTAYAKLRDILKDNLIEAQHEAEIITLGTALAVEMYFMLPDACAVKLGDVSVTKNNGENLKMAKQYKSAVFSAYRHLLKDSSFVFKRMEAYEAI